MSASLALPRACLPPTLVARPGCGSPLEWARATTGADGLRGGPRGPAPSVAREAVGTDTVPVMADQSLTNIIEAGWAQALDPVSAGIAKMGDFLRREIAEGRTYLPSGDNVLRAFKQPFADVRVLIVGQDPYPTPGHPVGLSFSVDPNVRRIPGSLVNIFREYSQDLGYSRPSTGDLTPWTQRGVLLLNRVLTVQPGKPGSHRGKGWEAVTEQAIRALAARHERGRPLVAILWGKDARSLAPMLAAIPRIESAHPSPMVTNSDFFGSRPFSRSNQMLADLGANPVDWKLP
jgi:uracil-DNA glycosylase